MPRPQWTHDQVAALAPDAAGLKAGEKLSNPSKWATLGVHDRGLWGEIFGSGKKPYQVSVDFEGPAFKCSCPSRKFPCKHSVALALVFADSADSFEESAPAEWHTEWLDKRTERQKKKEERAQKANEPVDAETAAKRAKAAEKRSADREKRVREGVEELRLWLRDVVRQGLASLDATGFSQWEQTAGRMVDAQASGLAERVRALSSHARAGERRRPLLLEGIGSLHLLLEGYTRIDELSLELQADLRDRVGFTQAKEKILQTGAVEDRWWVLGKHIEELDNLRVQRDWLFGEKSSQTAMVLTFATGNQSLDVSLVPGTGKEGRLFYYPGSVPQRALLDEAAVAINDGAAVSPTACCGAAFGTVDSVLARHAEVLARQPWVDRIGVGLRAVTPDRVGGRFAIWDSAGEMLVVDPAADGWVLLAMSGGETVDLFGEWNGRHFLPLAVGSGSDYYPLGLATVEVS